MQPGAWASLSARGTAAARRASPDGKKQSRLDKGPSCKAVQASPGPLRPGGPAEATALLLPALASLLSVLGSEGCQTDLSQTCTPPPRPTPLQPPPRHTRAARRGAGTPVVWEASEGRTRWSKDALSSLPRPLWYHLDGGTQPFTNRIRGNPREKSALLPDLLGQIWGGSLETPKAVPSSGRGFPGSREGPGVGVSGAAKAAEGAATRAGQAFRRVSPAGGPLTVQGQEVPTRVHARRGSRRRGRGEAQRAGGLGWERGSLRAPTEPRREEAGGGPTAPHRPPGPPTRASPRPLRGTEKGRRAWGGGPGSPANPGRGSGQLGAPGPEIVRSLRPPPPPPPTGPVITASCRPHALAVGASPRCGCG